MSPTLQNSDYILAYKLPFSRFRIGDIVIVQHPQFSEIIKRINNIDSDGFIWLAGDGIDSLSSEKMGPIHLSQVIAKMCWHIQAKT